MANYKVLVEATSSVVDVEDLKRHLFIFDNEEDTYLQEILFAAQQNVADYIGEFPVVTTLQAEYADLNDLTLPQRYVSAVSTVEYYDYETNVLQTIDPTDYLFVAGALKSNVLLLPTYVRPQLSTLVPYPVRITYDAVINPTPDSVRQAVRIVAGEMYQSRSETTNLNVQDLPLTLQRLLNAIKRR